ncbi:MAG: 3-phosphoshikimate 1-carboxyvinyltransferase, partial [Spirochaetota bacterium]
MNWTISPSALSGTVRIPGSKSHTIRSLICGMYAEGESVIRNPLISSDTVSGKEMVHRLGAEIKEENGVWRVKKGHFSMPGTVQSPINVGNSGTSLYFG